MDDTCCIIPVTLEEGRLLSDLTSGEDKARQGDR